MNSKIVFILAAQMLASAESVPTCDQISTMSSILLNTMSNQTSYTLAKQRAFFLRLGFHDCVGGCNGCINFNNPDNAGLLPAVTILNTTYYANGFDKIISLADFFALAATVSIKSAVQASNLQRSGTFTAPANVTFVGTKNRRVDG